MAIVDAFEHAGKGNVANDRRLVAADDASVSFSWEDYRIEGPGRRVSGRLFSKPTFDDIIV